MPTDDVVGQVQVTIVGKEDTLSDIARRFDVGYEEIVRANPERRSAGCRSEGREVVVPTQFVLPFAERKGIVVNIAAMRVYYFPPMKKGEKQVGLHLSHRHRQSGLVHARGQDQGHRQGEGSGVATHRRRSARNTRTMAIRFRRWCRPVRTIRWASSSSRWAGPRYLIHGTNKPYGVGLRSSHGCIRLYPEDIEQLYGLVGTGTPVTVVNQPFVFGWHEDQLYLQAYDVLEDDKRDWSKSRPKLLAKTLSARIQQQLAARKESIDWERVAQHREGSAGPRVVGVARPSRLMPKVIAAAPRVQNRVPEGSNWDGTDDTAIAMQNDVQEMVGEQRQVPRS